MSKETEFPMLEIHLPSGETYKIWENGESEGFPDGTWVKNCGQLQPIYRLNLGNTLPSMSALGRGCSGSTCLVGLVMTVSDGNICGLICINANHEVPLAERLENLLKHSGLIDWNEQDSAINLLVEEIVKEIFADQRHPN